MNIYKLTFVFFTAALGIFKASAQSTASHINSKGRISSISLDSIDYTNANKITIAKKIKNKIEDKNDKLHYDTNNEASDKIVSSYHNYTIDFEKSGEFEIEVVSLCSCIGFNKNLFVPMIKFENNDIKAEVTDTKMLEPSFSLPARLTKTWKISIGQPMTLNFTIYSDNSKLKQVIYESSGLNSFATNGYVGYVSVDSKIKMSSKGKYLLVFKEL
jgi:hypothetical protein